MKNAGCNGSCSVKSGEAQMRNVLIVDTLCDLDDSRQADLIPTLVRFREWNAFIPVKFA